MFRFTLFGAVLALQVAAAPAPLPVGYIAPENALAYMLDCEGGAADRCREGWVGNFCQSATIGEENRCFYIHSPTKMIRIAQEDVECDLYLYVPLHTRPVK